MSDSDISDVHIDWNMVAQRPIIEHDCHPHPLWKLPFGNLGWLCNECNEPFQDTDVRYWCYKCDYDICQECMDNFKVK